MQVSRKCQYTLRALFELAKRRGEGPVSAAEIATAQALPPRFLELILHALTKSGEVKSRRGIRGGYVLAVSPDAITVGDVVRLVDGSAAPVDGVAGSESRHCPPDGECAILGLWARARQAIEKIYDSTTLQDLLDDERSAARRPTSLTYCI